MASFFSKKVKSLLFLLVLLPRLQLDGEQFIQKMGAKLINLIQVRD
jgi:hypothetical protein